MAPCGGREAVVSVAHYENGRMKGSLRHPRLNEKEEIQSLSQMILLLNSLLDLENCPNPPLPLVKQEREGREELAVFRIQILFREHYTWQGRLTWQNQNKEFVFRSALELIQLLDEILSE